MLVGEIRDLETADIAVQASLTGHLVFSTIHTNDSASTFTRLTDMGVEPFLIASSVVACMAIHATTEEAIKNGSTPMSVRRVKVLAESLVWMVENTR